MNIQEKNRLLDMITSIMKAVDKLQHLSRGQKEYSEVCTVGQELLIQVGNILEKKNVGLEIIPNLEKLCELFYQIYIEDNEDYLIDYFHELGQTLESVLDELSKLQVKPTIVFMPYKASMWDCLESIWQTAIEDQCDCYVVPIPFYQMVNEDKSQLCYEGSLFPLNVPITHYKDFKLEEIRPDIIYIHNAFDDYNRITSVHPEYYTKALKKYCKKLVYVPYYLAGAEIPEEHIQLPGYQNIDYIILQDQQQMVEMGRIHPFEKLLPLGNPKLDKMYWYQTNKIKIPREWEQIVKGKKLVLFNISIKEFLKNNELVLNKMEYVFQAVLKRTDIALIFRPHPLLQTTIASMRPQLKVEYDKLMRYFRKNRVGVLDNNSDSAKTAVLCDGYIGSGNSSLAKYFGVLRKPVFILDYKMNNQLLDYQEQKVNFNDYVYDGESIWFIDQTGYCELCKVSLNAEEVQVISEVPDCVRETNPVSSIVKMADMLYLIPYCGNGIYRYDIKRETFQKYFLKLAMEGISFIHAVSFEKSIFLIPREYPAIVKLDTDTGDLVYYYEPIQKLKELYGDQKDKKECCWWRSCTNGNMLYIPAAHAKAVIAFNMENGSFQIHILDVSTKGFVGISYNGSDFWLTPYQSYCVVKWDGQSVTQEYLLHGPEGRGKDMDMDYPLLDVLTLGKKLLLFPYQDNVVRLADAGIESEKELDHEIKRELHDKKVSYSSVGYLDNQKVLALNSCGGIEIWDEEGLKESHSLQIGKKDAARLGAAYISNEMKADYGQKYCACHEKIGNERQSTRSLNNFFDYLILNSKKMPSLWQNIEGKCGHKIHREILERSGLLSKESERNI